MERNYDLARSRDYEPVQSRDYKPGRPYDYSLHRLDCDWYNLVQPYLHRWAP